MFIAAIVGLAGSPWVGFAIAASMLVLVAIPQQLELLKRYAGEPKTDIVLGMLFESGMESVFDATIAVVADEEVRAQRAGSRGHEALAERSARQLSQQEKAERATYVVPNDDSVETLESKLSAVLDMLGP